MPPALTARDADAGVAEHDSHPCPDVHALLAAVAARDSDTIAQQRAIAGIAAPTGDEAARAAWYEQALRERGIGAVERDDAGNVIARFPGARQAPPVVVLTHLDTVFPHEADVAVRLEGARLVGAGINDNARGLAAALTIASELIARPPAPRPIVLVATVGEEGAGDLRGAKRFFTREPLAAAAIALDGAGDDRIVHRALGSRRFRVTFDGPGGHSWSAFGAPNAVHAASVCAARLARIALPTTPRVALTVARIGGGMCINAIPEHAWLEVDTRSADASTLEWLEREIHRAARAAADEVNDRRTHGTTGLAVTVERFGNRPPGATPVDHPLVRLALEVTRDIGVTPELALASTDANVPMSLGIPAIAVGAGGAGGEAHTAHEWFENVEGPRGIARALAIILGAAAL